MVQPLDLVYNFARYNYLVQFSGSLSHDTFIEIIFENKNIRCFHVVFIILAKIIFENLKISFLKKIKNHQPNKFSKNCSEKIILKVAPKSLFKTLSYNN